MKEEVIYEVKCSCLTICYIYYIEDMGEVEVTDCSPFKYDLWFWVCGAVVMVLVHANIISGC